MQDYDRNTLLKNAIHHHVSLVAYTQFLLNLQKQKNNVKRFYHLAKSQLAGIATMLASSKKRRQVTHKLILNLQGVTNDLACLFEKESEPTQKQIQEIFIKHGIDLSFLSQNNIDVHDFAEFVVDLSETLRKRQINGTLPLNPEEQAEAMTHEAITLIKTRYLKLERIIYHIPVFIKQVGSQSELHTIAVEVKTVLACEITETIKTTCQENCSALALPNEHNRLIHHSKDAYKESLVIIERQTQSA
ncbi:hypothetical protein MMH89_02665 [Candidatus Comchoanobacter bicostacola]|uniref:Uncharacterized protein n=1 Tax=Candidatus Comchoanobacter bicostacola TaxID=2919598 RepID=A0ABY5DJX7_9GAMM|nr:hypothetical protein [Candidatus Comchoanobacter bicostacola]UTC24127.1 hypothetical protein MMH89_02665 [Candidatus Comchoanobacter bicostacola]